MAWDPKERVSVNECYDGIEYQLITASNIQVFDMKDIVKYYLNLKNLIHSFENVIENMKMICFY